MGGTIRLSVEVMIYTVTRHDFDELQSDFTCPYIQLRPDYAMIMRETVELLLSEEEVQDIENKLSILHLTSS